MGPIFLRSVMFRHLRKHQRVIYTKKETENECKIMQMHRNL